MIPNPQMPPIGLQQVTPATPMEMLSRALMSGAAPETLEKMLALQERWEKSEAKKAFDRAIAKAKAEIPTIVKDREVSFGTGKTSYKHEDLVGIAKVVVPVLSKYGLSYRWRTEVIDKQIIVTCILSHEGGHSEENSLPGPADTSGSKNPIQAIASTVTYLQRYTLKCALGLAAGKDDDAVSAGNGNGPKPPDKLNDEQAVELTKAIEDGGRDLEWFCAYAGIDTLHDLAPERFAAALNWVKGLPNKVANATE